MKKLFVRLSPRFLKEFIKFSLLSINRLFEYISIKKQPFIHEKSLRRLQKKIKEGKKIKVSFFVVYSSMWKFDRLYKLLEKDYNFEPLIIVCPVMNYGKKNMIQNMEKDYNYFSTKNYNVIKSYDYNSNKYMNIKKKIRPDIIFYTNPYKRIIYKKYYITKFKRYLTCYVQYGFNSYDNPKKFYDQLFYNILWNFFVETPFHHELSIVHSRNKGINTFLTGYPGVDDILYNQRTNDSSWKKDDKEITRVIWAPHHSIEKEGMSNFLEYHDTIKFLSKKYFNTIQFAFKPHPLLKQSLFKHPDWGIDKTNNYYSSWENIENGFIHTDHYVSLFNSSDAMIHDSLSFIAEYLYTGKPVLYTIRNEKVKTKLNTFGQMALEKLYHGYSTEDIIDFLDNIVLHNQDVKKKERENFYEKHLKLSEEKNGASMLIINRLKHLFFTDCD